MSNAKKMVVAYKNWAFSKKKKKNGFRLLCTAFLKNGRRAPTLAIFKKPQALDWNIMAGLLKILIFCGYYFQETSFFFYVSAHSWLFPHFMLYISGLQSFYCNWSLSEKIRQSSISHAQILWF